MTTPSLPSLDDPCLYIGERYIEPLHNFKNLFITGGTGFMYAPKTYASLKLISGSWVTRHLALTYRESYKIVFWYTRHNGFHEKHSGSLLIFEPRLHQRRHQMCRRYKTSLADTQYWLYPTLRCVKPCPRFLQWSRWVCSQQCHRHSYLAGRCAHSWGNKAIHPRLHGWSLRLNGRQDSRRGSCPGAYEPVLC